MFLGGCPCCGPCWRCYGKYCLVGEKRYVPSVQLLDPINYSGYEINISEEYGWVAGSNAVDTVPGPPCNFFFQYENGDITDRLWTGFAVTVFLNRPDLSPTRMVASFQSPCGDIPVKRDLDGFEGRYALSNITNTGGIVYQPLNVGDNVFELQALSGAVRCGICPINIKIEEFQQDELPPLPAEYYKCFDAPPDEEGWEPVGKCHPNKESCQAACPPNSPSKGGRTMTTGPGTHLKNMLAMIGIREKEKGCKCGHWQKKMDGGGPQWCRDHKDEILDHLAKEAKKRGLPFVRLAAGKLVDLAIRKAEKDSA